MKALAIVLGAVLLGKIVFLLDLLRFSGTFHAFNPGFLRLRDVQWRHLVENFFCKIKEFRRIATRYDKTDTSFSAMIHLVGSVLATR